MKPLVSIIVPIYNIDKYLGQCIESIMKQTFRSLEIILVDDGSSDRSAELCDLYAEKDPRIKVIHKENGGLVSARKAGILASAGLYIGYVDGDDWVEENFCASLVSAIEENNADVAAAGFSRDLFSKHERIRNSIPSGVYRGESLKYFYPRMIADGAFFRHGLTTYVWNKLFRREVLIPHQLEVDERITIGEDAAVVYSLLPQCRSICVTEDTFYHYRQREDSMLKTSIDFMSEAFRLRLLYEHLERKLSGYPEDYGLIRQTEEFITSVYMTRSGCRVGSCNPALRTFPLKADLLGKRILLYGAGTFGKQLEKRLREDEICELAGWIDEDYWEYRRCCINVDPVERALSDDYDYVLIMNLNRLYSERIRCQLAGLGVPLPKIMLIEPDKAARHAALKEYLAQSSRYEE